METAEPGTPVMEQTTTVTDRTATTKEPNAVATEPSDVGIVMSLSALKRDPAAAVRRLTKYCCNRLLSMQGTKVIIVVGECGVGKSNLIEEITGATGLSGMSTRSVTEQYQMAWAQIDGELYVFVDTPGFDSDETSDIDVFREIMRCIETIRSRVAFAGVLYVTDLQQRKRKSEAILFEWLQAFCGTDYLPNITIVCTQWDGLNEDGVEDKDGLFDLWVSVWKQTLGPMVKTYKHGRLYENGLPSQNTLSMKNPVGREGRREQARDMIACHYGGKVVNKLQVVMELEQGVTMDETSAVKVLMRWERKQAPNSERISSHKKSASLIVAPRPNWWKIFWITLSGWMMGPIRPFSAFFKWLSGYLPHGTLVYPRFAKVGVELVFQMPNGTKFIFSTGPRGLRMYIEKDSSSDLPGSEPHLEQSESGVVDGDLNEEPPIATVMDMDDITDFPEECETSDSVDTNLVNTKFEESGGTGTDSDGFLSWFFSTCSVM